jgi:hypothetical protein
VAYSKASSKEGVRNWLKGARGRAPESFCEASQEQYETSI